MSLGDPFPKDKVSGRATSASQIITNQQVSRSTQHRSFSAHTNSAPGAGTMSGEIV